jgi:chaperonin GroEL (HSP60 family)
MKEGSDENRIGYEIVLDASQMPLSQIVLNAGVEVQGIIEERKKTRQKWWLQCSDRKTCR